jgi:hypothetical protein
MGNTHCNHRRHSVDQLLCRPPLLLLLLRLAVLLQQHAPTYIIHHTHWRPLPPLPLPPRPLPPDPLPPRPPPPLPPPRPPPPLPPPRPPLPPPPPLPLWSCEGLVSTYSAESNSSSRLRGMEGFCPTWVGTCDRCCLVKGRSWRGLGIPMS